MKKPLTTTWILLTILFIWVCISIYLSVTENDWTWFQRAGSIITLFGAILVSREVIRLGTRRRTELHDAPDTWKPSEAVVQEHEHRKEDYRSEAIGAVLILAGTVIWGYGDLVECLINT